jgi:hypothetical protein
MAEHVDMPASRRIIRKQSKLAGSIKWENIKELRLSQVDLVGLSGENERVQSEDFSEDWEEEFLDSSFHTFEITCFCFLYAVYCLSHFVFRVFINRSDGAGGEFYWVILTWTPELISGISCFTTALFMNIPRTSAFLKTSFNLVAAFVIVVAYLGAMIPNVMLEIRRSSFHSGAENNPTVLMINYSVFPPIRLCNISNNIALPSKYLIPDNSNFSCNNLIVSGEIYSFYLLLNIFPRTFRTNARAAILVSLSTTLVLFFALMSVGALLSESGMLLAIILQLFVGLSFAHFCQVQQKSARQQFALTKRTRFVSDQNRNLLYTLIPKNVTEKLSRHVGDSLLGSEIPCCIVMFCSVEPHDELQTCKSEQEFGLLDQVFSAFDLAVQSSGMFKYQHVR